MLAPLLTPLMPLLLTAIEQGPEDEDVVAGWTAFAIFGLLILAVAVLGFSLTKRLKNVAKAEEKGLYDPSARKRQAPSDDVEPGVKTEDVTEE